MSSPMAFPRDRKSTRLNSSHTEIYTLSLHDALPISFGDHFQDLFQRHAAEDPPQELTDLLTDVVADGLSERSEEYTSELQSHRDLHSFPTRRSSDLVRRPLSGSFPAPCRRRPPPGADRSAHRCRRRWPFR